jgi:hypothetical protein
MRMQSAAEVWDNPEDRFYIPPDNDELRKEWETPPKHGGTCGPSTLAVLERTTVKSVIDGWIGRDGEGWRGFSPIKEMKANLEKLGYSASLKGGRKSKAFPTPTTDASIVRIQWLKDDGTAYPWFDAPKFSHYVLMRKYDDQAEWMVFCNGNGWFGAFGEFAKEYFEHGYVSSYLELSKEGEPRS